MHSEQYSFVLCCVVLYTMDLTLFIVFLSLVCFLISAISLSHCMCTDWRLIQMKLKFGGHLNVCFSRREKEG